MTVRIEAVRGDITAQSVDAIVNAANSTLLGGGGVDGAVHAKAGPALTAACRGLRATTYPDGLPTGEAVATIGGGLPSRFVIHTVGPVRWEHAGGADLLASCHRRALEVAEEIGAVSVAFPAVSCGAFGWTPAEAAPVAVRAVADYAAAHPDSRIMLVRFVLFDSDALHAFEAASTTFGA